jgi:hypothetical protein
MPPKRRSQNTMPARYTTSTMQIQNYECKTAQRVVDAPKWRSQNTMPAAHANNKIRIEIWNVQPAMGELVAAKVAIREHHVCRVDGHLDKCWY